MRGYPIQTQARDMNGGIYSDAQPSIPTPKLRIATARLTSSRPTGCRYRARLTLGRSNDAAPPPHHQTAPGALRPGLRRAGPRISAVQSVRPRDRARPAVGRVAHWPTGMARRHRYRRGAPALQPDAWGQDRHARLRQVEPGP